ncbi:hypothetical protein INT47_009323, partial [Mucor saturninus]
MITGRWELKISNYGLDYIKSTQIESVDPLVRKLPIEENDAHILKSTKHLLWMAPESVIETNCHAYVIHPTREADVYSAGIIINQILTRETPYASQIRENNTPEMIFKQVCERDLRPRMQPPGQDEFTDGMNMIVSDCLQRNIDARPSFTAIGNRVEEIDPYFCGSGSVIDNMAMLLEKYANDMENLVKKRTFHLQQRTLELEEERARTETLLKDLKYAKEVAEAAAASKQNFLANMSHEIRTPMNAVIGMSRTLMESDLPPDLYECAETIESSGNHLMALIDDILDYSKIESGKLSLERSMLDLTYVIESAMKLLSSNYLSKGLVLWYNIAPDLPIHVIGDLVRLRQILLNLLSNAFKFTASGHVYVSVEPYQPNSNAPSFQEDDSNIALVAQSPSIVEDNINPLDMIQYLFSVKDTGIGIPKTKASKLFKSFSQVDASTTRNFGGTGLGLAISKKLCKIMGGDMWVESEEGQGSTFFFNVKLQAQPNSKTYSQEFNLKDISQKCPRPLVIADRESVRIEWNSLLSNMGISSITSMTILDAEKYLEKVSKEHISLLIIDTDFDLVNNADSGKTLAATSQLTLSHLQKNFSWIQLIPTLCITDSRMMRSRKRVSEELEANFSSSVIQHPQGSIEPLPTPHEEKVNPLEVSVIPNPSTT